MPWKYVCPECEADITDDLEDEGLFDEDDLGEYDEREDEEED